MMIKSYILALSSVVLAEVLLGLALIILPGLVFGITTGEIVKLIPIYSFGVAIVTIPIVVCIGMPIFAFLRRRDFATNRNLIIIGFTIPVAIYIFLNVFLGVGEGFSSGQSYYGTYREMIIDGVRTNWGWIKYLEELFKFGIHGLVGALVFKAVWFKVTGNNT
jgi:hypothetical protein